MRKLALVAGLAVLWGAGAAFAQDVDHEGDAPRPEDRRPIRVLQNPYDIASFYRSSQGGEGYGSFTEDAASGRYPIASYYRGHDASPYGYSRFWTNGYSYGRPLRSTAVPYGRYAHRIGQNGDLLLMAPTFLAPMGPLTGVFFGGSR
jgi:hypothetical protein